MQNNYYSLRALSSLGLYRPTKLASMSYSVSLCCLLICFRGGSHRADRWVLRGHRRVVWGSQVAAWDVVELAGWECLCVGLLGHILDLLVLDNYLATAWWTVGSMTSVCNLYLSRYMSCHMIFCVVESVMCQLFHKSWSLYYTLIAMPVFMAWSRCCVGAVTPCPSIV